VSWGSSALARSYTSYDSETMTSDKTINLENLDIFRKTNVHYLNCQFPTPYWLYCILTVPRIACWLKWVKSWPHFNFKWQRLKLFRQIKYRLKYRNIGFWVLIYRYQYSQIKISISIPISIYRTGPFSPVNSVSDVQISSSYI
jgi:hypothetical protein